MAPGLGMRSERCGSAWPAGLPSLGIARLLAPTGQAQGHLDEHAVGGSGIVCWVRKGGLSPEEGDQVSTQEGKTLPCCMVYSRRHHQSGRGGCDR